MQIYVRNVNGVTNTFEVDSSNTIADFRAKIQHKLGNLPSELFNFKFAGKVLHDDDDLNTLAVFNIHAGSTLDVMPRLRGGAGNNQGPNAQRSKEKKTSERSWRVNVQSERFRCITGCCFQADKHTTVDDVKTFVIRDAGLKIKKENVTLSYHGKVLEDGNRTLISHKINKSGYGNIIDIAWNEEDEEGKRERQKSWIFL